MIGPTVDDLRMMLASALTTLSVTQPLRQWLLHYPGRLPFDRR